MKVTYDKKYNVAYIRFREKIEEVTTIHISDEVNIDISPDGTIYGGNDGYLQAKRCFEIIERALTEAGATLADVVRTRMFVTDISRSDEFGRAHGEFFRDIKPAATMVEVSRLLTPEMLIEVEVDAVTAG